MAIEISGGLSVKKTPALEFRICRPGRPDVRKILLRGDTNDAKLTLNAADATISAIAFGESIDWVQERFSGIRKGDRTDRMVWTGEDALFLFNNF